MLSEIRFAFINYLQLKHFLNCKYNQLLVARFTDIVEKNQNCFNDSFNELAISWEIKNHKIVISKTKQRYGMSSSVWQFLHFELSTITMPAANLIDRYKNQSFLGINVEHAFEFYTSFHTKKFCCCISPKLVHLFSEVDYSSTNHDCS